MGRVETPLGSALSSGFSPLDAAPGQVARPRRPRQASSLPRGGDVPALALGPECPQRWRRCTALRHLAGVAAAASEGYATSAVASATDVTADDAHVAGKPDHTDAFLLSHSPSGPSCEAGPRTSVSL